MSNYQQPRNGQGFSDGLLSDYFIDDCIGHGSFATVYRAYHKITNKPAAIKIILSSRLNEKLLKSIEFEIKVLRDLKHPNITELYDIKRLPTKVCLIMELCSFGDLSDYIKKNRMQPGTGGPAGGLSEVIFRHFLQQLVAAFRFLREKNLVHRDLKPQNILLSVPEEMEQGKRALNYTDSLPQLKVADFGFAKILPSQTLTETACGSPLYMAPEILQRKAYDASADLWSIGAVLYEMVTGQPPFSAQTHTELIGCIKAGRDRIWFPGDPIDHSFFPQIPEKISKLSQSPSDQVLVSEDIKVLLRGLLKQNPANRITFEEFFSHPAVRNFEAPPLPISLVNKSRPSSSLSEAPRKTGNSKPGYGSLRNKIYPPTEAPKMSVFATGPRQAPSHNRSRSDNVQLVSGNRLEDEHLDKDYIMIDSIFGSSRSTQSKGTKPPRSSPRSIATPIRSHSTSHKEKISANHTHIKKPPKTLPEEVPSQDQSQISEKGSPPVIQPPGSNSGHSQMSQISESGWKVGENAASVLANAISRASSKLFGTHGLSPPAEQYRVNSSDPTAFPLEGTFANNKEEEALHDIELVACQAYAMAKFADYKLTASDIRDKPNDNDLIEKENQKLTGDITEEDRHELFFLYTKSLALLQQAYNRASRYWAENSLMGSDLIVSTRLSKAVRWLQDKTNECLEKAELIQSKISNDSFDIKSLIVDQKIYNFALNICQDGVYKEIKGEKITECEVDYLTGLWLLQAITFRTPQEGPLSDSDSNKIQLMLSLVEERLVNFRKALGELELRHSFINQSFSSISNDGRVSRG